MRAQVDSLCRGIPRACEVLCVHERDKLLDRGRGNTLRVAFAVRHVQASTSGLRDYPVAVCRRLAVLDRLNDERCDGSLQFGLTSAQLDEFVAHLLVVLLELVGVGGHLLRLPVHVGQRVFVCFREVGRDGLKYLALERGHCALREVGDEPGVVDLPRHAQQRNGKTELLVAPLVVGEHQFDAVEITENGLVVAVVAIFRELLHHLGGDVIRHFLDLLDGAAVRRRKRERLALVLLAPLLHALLFLGELLAAAFKDAAVGFCLVLVAPRGRKRGLRVEFKLVDALLHVDKLHERLVAGRKPHEHVAVHRTLVHVDFAHCIVAVHYLVDELRLYADKLVVLCLVGADVGVALREVVENLPLFVGVAKADDSPYGLLVLRRLPSRMQKMDGRKTFLNVRALAHLRPRTYENANLSRANLGK